MFLQDTSDQNMTIHISSVYKNTFATDIKIESNAEGTAIHPNCEMKYILPEDTS